MVVSQKNKPQSRGFTLVELMVTLAVMSILLGLAAPSFTDLIRRQRMQSATVEWLSLSAFARNEAIKTGHAISIALGDSGFRMLDATTNEVLREWQQPNVATDLIEFADLQFIPPLGILNRPEACVRLSYSGVGGYERYVYLGRSGQNLVFIPDRDQVPAKVQALCAAS